MKFKITYLLDNCIHNLSVNADDIIFALDDFIHKYDYNEIISCERLLSKDQKETHLAKIQKDFYNSLTPFVAEFNKQDLRDFYDYWSEPNKSRTKIRWQLEKTWDTKKRLQRWVRQKYRGRVDTRIQSSPNELKEEF